MTPAELLEGLSDRFPKPWAAVGGATLDWSYHLLEPDEQNVFRVLGVFVEGFDIAAVAAVTASGLRYS